jgi:hypothetical protein
MRNSALIHPVHLELETAEEFSECLWCRRDDLS